MNNPTHPYAVVVHTESGRAFGLDRGYDLMIDLMSLDDFARQFGDHEVIGDWDGWKPSGGHQVPAWAQKIPERELHAYWLTGH